MKDLYSPLSPRISNPAWTSLKSVGLTAGPLLAAAVVHGQPDYAPAHYVPITGCTKWYTSGNGHHFCVIHDMEGYYHSTISYLASCANTVSIYYMVNAQQNGADGVHNSDYSGDPPAGDITQEVREFNYAWHVGCWNQAGIAN